MQLYGISPEEKELLDMRFIEAVIDAKLAFSIIENPAMIALFKQLHPAYELPSRKEVSILLSQ